MNENDKNRIVELRKGGIGYKSIAQRLKLNLNTVKTFCRRNDLSGNAEIIPNEEFPGYEIRVCKQCGKVFRQYPGHREKLFCCVNCRTKWWNGHQSQVNRKSVYEFICPTCGKPFTAYGNRHRKYCSRGCYVADRFGRFPCE